MTFICFAVRLQPCKSIGADSGGKYTKNSKWFLVPQYMEDLTPQEEYDRMKTLKTAEYRPHGLGRPTKRDRRQLEYVKSRYAEE